MKKTESTKKVLAWDAPGMGKFEATLWDGVLTHCEMSLEVGCNENGRLIVRDGSADGIEFLRRVHRCVGELLAELDAISSNELQYNLDYRYTGAGANGEVVRGRIVDGSLELHGYPGIKFNPEHFTKVGVTA